MLKIVSEGLEYYKFEQDPFSTVSHGFFTREGGVSPHPWQSLNLSTTGGDSKDNVIENRKRIFKSIGKSVDSLYDTWQVHGTNIIDTDLPRELEKEPIQADGILTRNPEVTLFMRFADCVPVLFVDCSKKIVGIAHAGWKGTVDGVVSKMVELMTQRHGSKPSDIYAGIGPCICAEHYIIREDVLEKVKTKLPTDWNEVIQKNKSGYHLDLAMANKILLEKAGIRNIFQSDLCTACDTDKWFSHRAENGSTGRFATFISIGKL